MIDLILTQYNVKDVDAFKNINERKKDDEYNINRKILDSKISFLERQNYEFKTKRKGTITTRIDDVYAMIKAILNDHDVKSEAELKTQLEKLKSEKKKHKPDQKRKIRLNQLEQQDVQIALEYIRKLHLKELEYPPKSLFTLYNYLTKTNYFSDSKQERQVYAFQNTCTNIEHIEQTVSYVHKVHDIVKDRNISPPESIPFNIQDLMSQFSKQQQSDLNTLKDSYQKVITNQQYSLKQLNECIINHKSKNRQPNMYAKVVGILFTMVALGFTGDRIKKVILRVNKLKTEGKYITLSNALGKDDELEFKARKDKVLKQKQQAKRKKGTSKIRNQHRQLR